MAISLKTAGTWARVVADPSSVTIPGSPAAGDRMFLFVSWKTYTITLETPSGWNLLDDFSDGTTAAGVGTGSVHNAVYWRDWQSGDGNPSLNWSAAPTEAHAVIMLWQKGGSDVWSTPAAVHAAIAANDPFSATSSATITVPDGSVVMCLVGLRDDSSTIARGTDDIDDDGSPAVTWNGNYVESPATHFSSTTGQDMSGDLGHRFVTTGAAGVNLTVAGDPAAAETGTATWVVQGLATTTTLTPSAVTIPVATPDPTVTHPYTVTPSAVAIPITPTAPTVVLSYALSPSAIPVTIGVPVPSVIVDRLLNLDAVAIVINPVVPAVSLIYTAAPDPVAIPIFPVAPTIDHPYVLTPAAVAVPVAVPAPSLTIIYTVTPSAVAVPVAVPDPTLALSLAVAPTPVTIPIAIPTIILDLGGGGIDLTPDPVAVAMAIASPTMALTYAITPDAVAIPVSSPAIDVELVKVLGPDPVAVPVLVPAAGLDLPLSLAIDPASVILVVPAVSFAGEAIIYPITGTIAGQTGISATIAPVAGTGGGIVPAPGVEGTIE